MPFGEVLQLTLLQCCGAMFGPKVLFQIIQRVSLQLTDTQLMDITYIFLLIGAAKCGALRQK